MGKKTQPVAREVSDDAEVAAPPQSLTIAQRGLHTADDMGDFQNAIIEDVLAERVNVRQANACNTSSGLLMKAVDMKHKGTFIPIGRGSCRQDRCDEAKERRRKELLAELAQL